MDDKTTSHLIKMNHPRFSIITPSYNSEYTIKRTIESVLNQTITDYEYIIIDGGSTDNTIEIVKRYEPLFNGKLHWISERDSGIYNAMNKGVSMSSGSVIGIVNSDDWLETSALENIYQCIVANNLNMNSSFVITGDMRFHYNHGKNIVIRSSLKKFTHYAKVYRMGLNHPATFISKSTYDSIGQFDENLKLYADADLTIRIFKNNIPILFVNKVLSNMLDGGESNVYSEKIMKDNKYILKKHCVSNFEYYKLLISRVILTYIKYISSPLLKTYRQLANKKYLI